VRVIPLRVRWLLTVARFRFGPFEWLWRTLAYMKPQPMTRRRTAPARGFRRSSGWLYRISYSALKNSLNVPVVCDRCLTRKPYMTILPSP